MGLFGPPNIVKLQAKRDVKGLLKALRYRRDEQVRAAAASALPAVSAGEEAVNALIDALDDTVKVGAAAVEALREMGNPVVAQLVGVLRTADCTFDRAAAVKVLGKIGTKASCSALFNAFDDDPDVEEAATTVLQELGDSAVTALSEVLRTSDSRLDRAAAARALSKIGTEDCRSPLIEALTKDLAWQDADPDAIVRRTKTPGSGRWRCCSSST